MAEGVHYKTVVSEEEGQRLDNYLMRVLKGVPRTRIYRIIRGGEVRVNKKRAKASTRLLEGDLVRIPPVRTTPEKGTLQVTTSLVERLTHAIIFEDERLLVLNKPAGMAVHGGSGLQFGVIEALRAMRPKTDYLELIHRLDRETSGCLLIAKKRSMLREVQACFEARAVKKTYWLLSYGAWASKPSVRVTLPLRKNTLKSGERIVRVDEAGKPSDTTFKLRENYEHACWLEATPKTGRTHQIRVHAASLRHAIIGDEKYGASLLPSAIKKALGTRLYLHASAIQFTLNGTPYVFKADLDAQFNDALQVLQAA